MELKEYSNAAAVDFTKIPYNVYEIMAQILLREAAAIENGDELPDTKAISA